MPIPPPRRRPAAAAVAPKAKRIQVESFDDSDRVETPPEPPPVAPGASNAGVPVNTSSRAVNPRKQYPLHFDLLMRDALARGEVPESWQIIAAEEIRLDDMNMDVQFTMLDAKTNAVTRRCIEVQAGRLSRISER